MDIVDRSTLASLASWDRSPCASIYLPTHRAGREVLQDPIRFKNLLDRAREDLERTGMRSAEAETLLADARVLLDQDSFWQHQEDGLAVFVAPDRTDSFRLPVAFEERVVVGDAFHLKSLWPAVSWNHRFALLALSEQEVRLLAGTRYRITEIDLPDEIPTSLAEALWFDDPEKQLQHRSTSRADRGRVVATFHGHGVPEERDDARLRRFLRAVDAGIRELVDPGTPLVLAGTERPVAAFREVTEHRAMLDGHVHGNPETRSAAELHDAAWEIAGPYFERARADDVEVVMAGGDRRISTIEAAVPAALQGRMRILFAPADIEVWGQADPSGIVVHDEWSPGDLDLVDVTVVETWKHGGRVYVVPADDMPGDGPVAGLTRF